MDHLLSSGGFTGAWTTMYLNENLARTSAGTWIKYQVVKVSPGGSLPGERAGSELGARGASWGMLYYVLGSQPPLWGQGVRGAPSSLPSLPEHPWVPGTSLGPQEAPSLLPLLLACSPCSQSIPGLLEPSWGLRKTPTCFPCSQLAPLAPRASLGLWNLPGAPGSPQLTPLAPSTLPLLPEHPWNLPGASGSPQLAPLTPSLLPSLPARSPCS